MHQRTFLEAVTFKLRSMPFIGQHQIPLDIHRSYTEAEILEYLDIVHRQLYQCYAQQQLHQRHVQLLRTQLDDVMTVVNALTTPPAV